ncbi:MAG: DUF1080 domain-containing protein [Planctomycetia bacterium]|nr:DUF1080 domain-containing protein [Planctomycetia bacterium]
MHASRSPSSLVRRLFVAGLFVFGLSLIAGEAQSAQVAAADPAPTGTAKPSVPKPTSTVKPEAAKPEAAKPAAVPSDAPKPPAAKPATEKPSAAPTVEEKPIVEKPTAPKSATGKPTETKPETKPETVKPETVKPDTVKPATVKSAAAPAPPTVEKPVVKASEQPSAESSPAVPPSDANPFDGKSLAGWTTPAGKPVTGWVARDGAIFLPPGAHGGNIVTAKEYGNFSLSFEWKIAKGGNSGIKYRVRDYDGKLLGIEYQIYDDPPQSPAKGSAGSIYDLYAPNSAKKLKPVGEFNTAKITVRGNRLEHWLNGELIAAANVGTADWHKRVAESKFNDVKNFGMYPKGKLMLTDHGTEVWYRNIKFETYPDTTTAVRPTGRARPRLLRSLFGH